MCAGVARSGDAASRPLVPPPLPVRALAALPIASESDPDGRLVRPSGRGAPELLRLRSGAREPARPVGFAAEASGGPDKRAALAAGAEPGRRAMFTSVRERGPPTPWPASAKSCLVSAGCRGSRAGAPRCCVITGVRSLARPRIMAAQC
jgi:hypothetical protein